MRMIYISNARISYLGSLGKRATLERSDLKSENIGLPVELRMPSFQKNGSTNSFYIRPFRLSLKPIKIDPAAELARVAPFVKRTR